MQPSNILKIESLDENWRDKDCVMLHACFQLLKDCIEKENLLSAHTDWNADDRHKKVRIEIEELYSWWSQRVKKDDQTGLTEQEYKEDDVMLLKLINVRWALWT